MSAIALRCRACGAQYTNDDVVGSCADCFGPLQPVYDWDSLRGKVTHESIASGPPSIWRYAPLLPVPAPADARLAPGLTPLLPAPRLASALGLGRLSLKLDTANPTHSFKDRAVAVAAVKAHELGISTLACSSTGNLANAVAARAAADGMAAAVFCPADLEPEKLVATAVYGATIYAVDGSYDDCSRLTLELLSEVPWGFVNVGLRTFYAEGSKTIAFEVAEQLDWRLPDALFCPIGSGALFSRIYEGFEQLRTLGLASGDLPRMFGAQAAGCAPVATAFETGRPVVPVKPRTLARSIAIGDPADGDLAVEVARGTGGGVFSVPEEDIGRAMGSLAETTGVFGETAAGTTLAALQIALERGQIREDDHVVVLVSGDGLKTPEPVSRRLDPVGIEPNVASVLERLPVAVR
jgi:threonine synthase